MPRSDKYSSDSGKHSGAASGGPTGVPSADGGFDSGAEVMTLAEPSEYVTRVISEQNLTVFERENVGKKLPFDFDGTSEVYLYKGSPSDVSRDKAKGPNETWTSPQTDTCRDFSKGHGAAAPTQLNPQIVRK